MRKALKRFRHCVPEAIYGFITLALGIYLACHRDYLDDPHVTWLPVPWTERYVSFVDDWWFSTLLIAVSLLLIYGILSHNLSLKRWTMIILVGVYALLFFSFGVRGLVDGYINTSWATDLGMLLFGFWSTLRGERTNAQH